MTTTPNLQIPHIVSSQAQKEVTANTAFDALDKALCQFAKVALADADLTLTAAQMLGNMALSFTGTLTTARTITAPAYAKLLLVCNDTDGDCSVIVKISSGTEIALGNGAKKLLYCDGNDFSIVAESGALAPYDIGGCYAGQPTAGAVLLRYPMPRDVRFPASLVSSQGIAGTAATAAVSFSMRKDGIEFATMGFAASGTNASFICSSATDFTAGDILTLVAPSTPDDTLADIGFSLAGLRI